MVRRTKAGAVRHDAKYSVPIVELFQSLLNDEAKPVAGPIVDPFAGTGQYLELLCRDDVSGIELEPEWAECSDLVVQGDATDPGSYPAKVGTIVTSPCYGNRFAGNYLGKPCDVCGHSAEADPGCEVCEGTGWDARRRYGYAVTLARPLSEGSGALHTFGKQYRALHRQFLKTAAEVLEPGARRFILNMSDHSNAQSGHQYVVAWWIKAAADRGFRMVEAHTVETRRMKNGANRELRADSEMVIVFDLLTRTETVDARSGGLQQSQVKGKRTDG